VTDFRVIPSIEQLRRRETIGRLEAEYGHEAVVAALRAEAEALRRRIARQREAAGADRIPLPDDADGAARAIEQALGTRLRSAFRPSLSPVINATGVVIHTNLGRAPLARVAAERVAEIASGYSNLEYDLERGERGARDAHAAALLSRLSGAETAVVVNNNAAATLVMLAALAAGGEVIISRGELVEIGGGFRIPEVMAQSGAILREVGTTNKTRVSDYADAVTDRTALILRVHRSNFRIEGFTEQPSLAALGALARERQVNVANDLGSGCLLARDHAPGGGWAAVMRDEPTVRESLDAGMHLVCFSGDKLLGGPQAGIIVGRRDLVDRIRRHPLMRALRADKMTYAALEATLIEYLKGRPLEGVPVARMVALTPEEIELRARLLLERLQPVAALRGEILDGTSMVGGGSAPGVTLPTRLLALSLAGDDPSRLDARLRRLDPPVIARIENDRLVLDLRTVLPEQDDQLVRALLQLSA
jgi:L-seryl-tRNA(Ser) seleniumtransferase